MAKELTTINEVDVSPLIKEMVNYAKDQNAVGDLEQLISKVPMKDSMDWKLISGVIMNSLVEWIMEDKDARLSLLQHLQGEVGCILKRIGLTQ